MYSCSSRVKSDNVEVAVSYVKVQLNITQINLAAVIKIDLEFFKPLNRNKLHPFRILPWVYRCKLCRS